MTPDILITTYEDFEDEVKSFYQACQRDTKLDPDDTLVIAMIDDEIVGVVRLCEENETHTLRTMQIHPKYQKKGIGRVMLESFSELITEREIKEVYCLPFEHLEAFYGKIGFVKIREDKTPGFLIARKKELLTKKPNERVIFMKLRK